MASAADNPARLPERRVLESWKEIAAHFGVTTRTAQLWELERGLPVRRKPGPKGRVFAYQDELDGWTIDHETSTGSDASRALEIQEAPASAAASTLEAASEMGADGEQPATGAQIADRGAGLAPEMSDTASRDSETPMRIIRPSRKRWAVVALVLVVLLVSAGTYASRLQSRSAFVNAVADEHSLRGVDREGRTLWTYEWPKPYFPAFAQVDDPMLPLVADLDNDGARELYIWHQIYKAEGRPEHNATLYAFDAAGKVRWTFQVTEPIRSERRVYQPPYAGRAIKPVRYDRGNRRGILALANHSMYHPGRAILLSTEGHVLREYLHAGHLHASLVDDLDGDGCDEIYLLSITNSYQSSDLVVLDPDRMGGASEELSPFQLSYENEALAAVRAPERARWVLPRTALSQTTEPYSGPGVLVRDGSAISVSTVEGRQALPMAVVTYFRLLPNLELTASGVSDNFEQHWNELWKSGVLRKRFDPGDLQVLQDIRLLPSAGAAAARAEAGKP